MFRAFAQAQPPPRPLLSDPCIVDGVAWRLASAAPACPCCKREFRIVFDRPNDPRAQVTNVWSWIRNKRKRQVFRRRDLYRVVIRNPRGFMALPLHHIRSFQFGIQVYLDIIHSDWLTIEVTALVPRDWVELAQARVKELMHAFFITHPRPEGIDVIVFDVNKVHQLHAALEGVLSKLAHFFLWNFITFAAREEIRRNTHNATLFFARIFDPVHGDRKLALECECLFQKAVRRFMAKKDNSPQEKKNDSPRSRPPSPRLPSRLLKIE